MHEAPSPLQAVALVLCPAYQGATLLSLLLSQHQDVTAMGDTLPTRAHPDFWCSCGQQIQHCEFWHAVHDAVQPEQFPDEEKWIPELPPLSSESRQNLRLNTKWLRSSALKRRATTHKTRKQAVPFLKATSTFWETAARQRDTPIVVDGAKSIWRHLALTEYKGVPYPVIQLTRDPRAYVASYRENIADDSAIEHIANTWRSYHEDVESLCVARANAPCLRVKYEDLCADTEGTMSKIFEFLGADLPMKRSNTPHHVIGNRMLAKFDGTITLDERYMAVMSKSEQQDVLEACAPLGHRYGYS